MFGNSKQYAIELDGLIYRCSKNNIDLIDTGFQNLNGDHIIVTDFQNSISGVRVVDAVKKYAELLLRKSIQESGDFDGPVSIISHWKKKKRGDATTVFFTSLPAALYSHYIDQIQNNENNLLILPLYSVLFSILKMSRPNNKPLAIVFQHGKVAELIIGTKKTIYYANRCVAYDTSDEQISNLWSTVKQEINLVESENGIQVEAIKCLTWINSQPIPEWTSDEYKFQAFETEKVIFQDESYAVSFLKAVRNLPNASGITPFFDKMVFYSKRLIPALNIIVAAAILMMMAGYFWYHSSYNSSQKTLAELRKINIELQAEFKRDVSQKDYKKILGFVKNLNTYKNTSSFKRVIHDISNAVSTAMELEVLKIDYTLNDITLEIFGRMNAPFKTSHTGYQSFKDHLKKIGYVILESRFDTEINKSEFLIKLTKRIQ